MTKDARHQRTHRLTVAVVALLTVAASLLISSPSSPELLAGHEETPQLVGMRTIVIDPGHGGSEPGTAGPGGLLEKDITLDIAVRLRDMIYRRLGLQVVLTREADVDVPLDERPEKANYWKGDLFVSIHANAYRAGEVRGPETYFLSDRASDAIARRAADGENSVATGPEPTAGQAPDPASDPALRFILWDLAQTQYLRESSSLAETIQAGLNELYRIPDRGVKQAPFRVLKGATMPAVLVEVGYLSNPEDADRLADPDYRQRIAESLYRSIAAFREQHAALVGAPPAP